MSILDPYHVNTDIVEPTGCLLGRKFKLVDNYYTILIEMDELLLLSKIEHTTFPEHFELEFGRTDSDGNVTIKDVDITLPFKLIKEVL